MNTLNLISDNKEEIVKAVNKHRLDNKGSWYQFRITYDGTVYTGKAYNTWIQILRYTTSTGRVLNNSSCMDISVKAFKEHLFQSIN